MSDSASPVRAPFRAAAGRTFGKWIGIGLAATLFVTVGLPRLPAMLGVLGSPFKTRTVDRTGPALLQAVNELHEYHAASGTFDVVVDMEKDVRFFPSALRGERVVMMARGTVDAAITFKGIDASDFAIDGRSVTLTVPHARLKPARIDVGTTKIVQHRRGVFDRVGSLLGGAPERTNDMYRLAQRRLQAAALASNVRAQAEQNTRAMLQGLIRPLGFDSVHVVFADPPPIPRDG